MARHYAFNLRSGLTFWGLQRIAERLTLATGIRRIFWINRKGRGFIMADGVDGWSISAAGFLRKRPSHDSIDWENGCLAYTMGKVSG